MGTRIQVTALTSGYAAVDVLNATLTALADEFDNVSYYTDAEITDGALTAQDKVIALTIDGTIYYIAAKLTND